MIVLIGLIAETNSGVSELWELDLSQFDSVKAFASKFETDGGRLDYLVCNAAVSTFDYSMSPDGWESTYVDFTRVILTVLTRRLTGFKSITLARHCWHYSCFRV